ncbi:hypothetical protein BDQ17DRAFT_1371042 [Cyathus striatus]|nr:hypothetical protein BDQ17DRAFT_1371042 [Cyathus striatus]
MTDREPRSAESHRLVKLVLPAVFYPNLNDDRYGLVFKPQTYEDAQRTALKVFGEMLGINVEPHNIILRCCIKNRDGNWVWADMIKKDWEKILNASSMVEIGVFCTNKYNEILGPTYDQHMVSIKRKQKEYGSTPTKLDQEDAAVVAVIGVVSVVLISLISFLAAKTERVYK